MCDFTDKLTPREREVYALIMSGRSNDAAAKELGISRRTVEIHRSNITDKAHAAGLEWRRLLVRRLEHGQD